MTFEQNWQNLQARRDAQNAGTLTQATKDKYPLTPNFIKWANGNFTAVKAKLECQPDLETAKPFSFDDYTNLLLLTSNSHLEKESVFPISDELQASIDGQDIAKVREHIAAEIEGCVICSAPVVDDHSHCEVCEVDLLQNGLFPNGASYQQSILFRLEHDARYIEQRAKTIADLQKRARRARNTTIRELEENGRVFHDVGDESYLTFSDDIEIPDAILNKMIDTRKIDARIDAWNPRIKPHWERPTETDEFGAPINDEYREDPEIIEPSEPGMYSSSVSDVPELNDHYVGTDENDEDVYRDFDSDGFFIPSGNPNNSSDTRDDIDLSDHTEYRANDWQSADLVNDHHHDEYLYAEVGITETPKFREFQVYNQESGEVEKREIIEWDDVPHENAIDEIPDPTIHEIQGDSFLTDALNWIQREQYLDKSGEDHVSWEIEQSFPVSEHFMERLKELDMDWETFQTRLSEELESLKGEPEQQEEIDWV